MPAETTALVVSASMALITFLSGAMLAAVPWLTRRREAFAVTVPESAQADPRIRRLKRAYLVIELAVSAVAAAAAVPLVAASPLALTAIVCLPVAAGFALMLVFRSRVRAIKRSEGWEARGSVSSAFVERADGTAPRPLPLTWELLHLPVMLATLALTMALYPSMPEQVPIHFNMAGEVDSLVEKGWRVVLMPIAIQTFLAVCLAVSHWMMLRSKRPSSPEAPAASAIAYGTFARAQSVMLVVMGLALNAAMALMPLTFAGVISSFAAFVAILAVSVVVLVLAIGVSLAYGQSGSRLLRRMGASTHLDFDDDALWRAGVFYVNREDPSVVVPKRFGVGWAVNWGNPRSWAIMAGFVVLIVAFMVGIGLLAG